MRDNIESLILRLAQDERIYFFRERLKVDYSLYSYSASNSSNSGNLKPWKKVFTVRPD